MATLTYNASISTDGSVVVLSSTSGGLSAASLCAILIKDNQTRMTATKLIEAIERRVHRDFSAVTDDLTKVTDALTTKE